MAEHAGFDPSEVYIDRGGEYIPRNVVRVEVHPSVKEIEYSTFENCRQLESVLLHEGLLRIGDWAFEGCSSLRSLRCPSTVTGIGVGAFYRCSNLATVELPDGLEEIKRDTFHQCESLEAVRIPSSVAQIGDEAFTDCTNLASVEIREGLRIIGGYAFWRCRSMGSLRVPLSVDEIGDGAFYGCSGLSLVRLHENLSTIRRFAFRGCPPESFQFARISERVIAVSMDEQTTSMFESRLSEMMRTLTDADDYDEHEDPVWQWGGDDGTEEAEAVWEKCKECLERAHKFLTYLELKGASPVLELALWKTKIEGEVEGRVQGGLVSKEVRGQDQEDTLQARETKKLKANKDTDRGPQLSRTDCRVKCGAGIVSSEVLKFFAFDTTWPRMDD